MASKKDGFRISDEMHGSVQQERDRSKIFIFKDDKSKSYGFPIAMETKGMFLRQVQEELQRGQMIWAKHPQDFSIFEIGEYDVLTGQIFMYESKNCLGLVQDFRQSN